MIRMLFEFEIPVTRAQDDRPELQTVRTGLSP
jgi:hypothetical protein